jgi:LCP family protein required for cell wall assembly
VTDPEVILGRSSRLFLRRFGLALLIASTVAVIAVLGSQWYVEAQIRRVDVGGLQAGTAGGENVLLVGSTDRCGLKRPNAAFGLCSQGVTGINSDVVMIVHLDLGRHRASILSIPRDTFVPNARTTGAYKIDAALYQGSSQLVAAIRDAFGIPINHYVELNFDGFQGVVDAVGGIRMYFPEPVYDHYSGLDVPTPGCRSLNGADALALARARHLQYKSTAVGSAPSRWRSDPESDQSRIRRDHEFLRVLASTVAKRGLADPISDEKLLRAIAPQLKVDAKFTLSDMAQLVAAFHTLDPNAVPQLTLPVSVSTSASFRYKGSDYGSVALPVEPEDHRVIDQFLGFAPAADTMTGHALPSPPQVTVAVLNGTGVPGRARSTASELGALGFKVVSISDSIPTGPISETVVNYAAAGDRAAAQEVARALSGVVVLAQGVTTPGAAVTVVAGSDFAVNSGTAFEAMSSSPRTTPPTARATATITQANSAITSRRLSAPTPPTSSLAEFDPRSCTASGGPGP